MSDSLLELVLRHPEFSRKSRLPSLFSDFSQLSLSNRDGYEANVGAWLGALGEAVFDSAGRDSVCITLDSALGDRLSSPRWGRPLALAAVEGEAVARRAWVEVTGFLESRESIRSVPTTTTLFSRLSLGSVVRWGVSRVYNPSARTRTTTAALSGRTYVIVENLDRLVRSCAGVLRAPGGLYSDHITTPAVLERDLERESGRALSPRDLAALLVYLARDEGVLARSDTTIKFAYRGNLSITDSDEAVAQVKATRASMARTTESLQDQEAQLETQLKAYVAAERRALALGALKSLKRVQRQLDAALDRDAQLAGLLAEIDRGVSQVELLDGMALGSQVLGQVLEKLGGVEAVEKVVDTVREQTQQVEEVASAMRVDDRPGLDNDDDDEEVEAEYEALLKDLSTPPNPEKESEPRRDVAQVDSESAQSRRKESGEGEREQEPERVPVLAS
ncbi:SNF7 family protein [Taphrina deformans PYCC 5710]|uniref:SNF7 family protein n=1 Tax=Taphrina deformans (strain PYCC 5710 / ATCC 11124 / CBS 356.35 / IMI 108563 / JCM 9778 / NBRC 8474) TaxID=1097556 RepID=R4XE23_TAPDE|nr:SNF7 family protein [Taphrina deformans PYCC 5710]|eukprot:CCG82680.1 SNF7 family protein [Taphrina deformans PYCC 5710]